MNESKILSDVLTSTKHLLQRDTLCCLCKEPMAGLRADRFTDGSMAHYICIVNGDYQRQLSELQYKINYATARIEHVYAIKQKTRWVFRTKYVTRVRFVSEHKRQLTKALRVQGMLKTNIRHLQSRFDSYKDYVARSYINVFTFNNRYLAKGGAMPKKKKGRKDC